MSSDASTDIRTLVVSTDGSSSRVEPTLMETLGWQERRDLQPWVRDNPDLIEPGLLFVAEEFADWEAVAGRISDRLDLLFLDEEGHLVVVELKRGQAPDRTHSQALLYAAFCDQLTLDDVAQQYAKTHSIPVDAALETIIAHAPSLEESTPGRVRVRLVAEDFPAQVTATVLFLREIGSGGPSAAQLDIGCIKLAAYGLPDGSHMLTAQALIPLPETEAYQVRRCRRAAADEDARERQKRVANAIPVLQRASRRAGDAIEVGPRLVQRQRSSCRRCAPRREPRMGHRLME
jgi:hypothetical protein